ncbi:hypothetical protein ALC60_08236, partial [Trachymyrmex zeteki]
QGVAAFATIENRRELKRTSRAKSTIKAFCDLLKCRADAAATSYIILETETDNEIPPLTVGVRSAINHDKKHEIVSLREAGESD